MRPRRILHSFSDQGEALGYEAATPYLTLPSEPSRAGRAIAPAAARSRGLVSPAVLWSTVLGLGTTSIALLALLA